MLACYFITLSLLHQHATAKPAVEHTPATDDSDEENDGVDSTAAAEPVKVRSTLF